MSIQKDIDFLRLEKHSINDMCDFCDTQRGDNSYRKITTYPDVEQADYYICEKCIPDLAEATRKQLEDRQNHYVNIELTGAQ